MPTKPLTFPLLVKSGSVTVKIYKVRNKSRLSFMVDCIANGRRQQKMFASFAEARAEANAKAQQLSRGELDVLHISHAEGLTYLRAAEAIEATGLPLDLAAREYAEAWKILAGRTSVIEAAREFARRHTHGISDKMLPDAVAEMIAAKRQEGATQVYLKALQVHLLKFADAFHCRMATVTTGQIADYLRALGTAARSKNNARQTIGAFLKYCRERGWLPRDHEGISLVPKFKEQPRQIEIFTPKEIQRFLAFSRPELIPFLAIGAFAGLRSKEIQRLDWQEVNLGKRIIEIKALKSKTASRRLVPIPENLAKWLAPHAKAEGLVVPFDNINKQIAWLVEDTRAGLEKSAQESDEPVCIESLQWKKNGLRHSYISYRVAQTQNVNQTALECGNSAAIIFRNYRELVHADQAVRWFSIVPGEEAVD